jgi:hypothetical protein
VRLREGEGKIIHSLYPIGYRTEHEGFADGNEIEEALMGYENG